MDTVGGVLCDVVEDEQTEAVTLVWRCTGYTHYVLEQHIRTSLLTLQFAVLIGALASAA